MLNHNDMHRDPLTNQPGAHPMGTGIGAAGGALAGMAAGAIGGPLTMAVGGVAGAITGGLAGKAVAESVNPTADEDYWQGNYREEPYHAWGRSSSDTLANKLDWAQRAGVEFDAAEESLTSGRNAQHGASSLMGAQARPATRAAWERLDPHAAADPSDGEDIVATLNDLIETCRDGEYGFRASSEHAQAQSLKTLFRQRADDCSDAAAELQGHILRMGGKPEGRGTAGGALHRGWVAVRGTLSGYSDNAMLEECERGEDVAMARYRKALQRDLPVTIRTVVERQCQGAQKNHDQIKALRDEARRHT